MDLRNMLQQGTSEQHVDYCLTTDHLMRFRDGIYVPKNNEIKKLILRFFYLNHIQVTQDIRRH